MTNINVRTAKSASYLGNAGETHEFTSVRDFVAARSMRVANAFDLDGLKVALSRDDIKRLVFVELADRFADKEPVEASLHDIIGEYLADRHVTMQTLLERWIRNAMRSSRNCKKLFGIDERIGRL